MRALLVVALLVTATACQRDSEDETPAYLPAVVQDVAGGKQVTFTAEGANRVGLRTALVRARTVPYTALIYDAEGLAWVFVVDRPLRFLRTQVTVSRIEGQVVRLTTGPADGTAVVTVGAAEAYGAERDIAGGH